MGFARRHPRGAPPVTGKYTALGTQLGSMADAEIAALTALLTAAGGDEPKPNGSGLIFSDDFTSYQSTADVLNYVPSPGKGYLHMTPENGVLLDATAGINGKPAVHIPWMPKAGCADDSHLIERVFPAVTELCASWTVRYSPAFVWDWLGAKPCVGNAKKLFFFWPVSGARFDCICENHHIGIGSDQDHPLYPQSAPEVTPEMLGDGAWHRITVRVTQSSTLTAADGHIQGWIDGVKKWDVPNWVSASTGGYNDFKLPTTFNQGSPATQDEWYNSLAIWIP